MGNWPLFNVQKNSFFCWPFWACFDLEPNEPNVDLSSKITFYHTFPFMLFSYFSIKIYLYKKIKLSIKNYLLLIYTFMCIIIFLRITILSFQSHQTRILSAGLGMVWNRDGLSWNWGFPFLLNFQQRTLVFYFKPCGTHLNHNLCANSNKYKIIHSKKKFFFKH